MRWRPFVGVLCAFSRLAMGVGGGVVVSISARNRFKYSGLALSSLIIIHLPNAWATAYRLANEGLFAPCSMLVIVVGAEMFAF